MTETQGSPTPSNAIIFSYFHPLACKSWLTIITCRSLLTVGRMILERHPYLAYDFLLGGACPQKRWDLALYPRSRTYNIQAVMCLGALPSCRGCSTDTTVSGAPLGRRLARRRHRKHLTRKPVKLRVTFDPDRNLGLDECLVAILSWITVGRSGAVGSRSPEVTGAVRRGVALILPGITAVHAIGAARAAVVTSVIALT